MTDNTNKAPRFKEGDVIYIASTNDRLYCSLAYGLYKGIVKRVYKDTYKICPWSEESSLEWHYVSNNNPFISDVCERDFIMTEQEFRSIRKPDKNCGYPYFNVGNFLFKVID